MNTGPQNTFRALADTTRREILLLLTERDMSIGDVASHFEITRGAVKKHLAILEEGDLISVRTAGRERINHFEPGALRDVADWLHYFDRFWEQRLDKLQRAVAQENK